MSAGRLVNVNTGESFPLGFEPVTVGRHPDNSVILADQQVSRHHAEIVVQGGRWVVRDLESANGTYVNDVRVERPYVLNPNDVVRFGQISFQMELPLRAAERDTIIESRPVPAPAVVVDPEPQSRRDVPRFVLVLLLIALVAVAATVTLFILPRLMGGNQPVVQASTTPAKPAATSTLSAPLTVLPTEEPQPSPLPTETFVPTEVPPTPAPSATPTSEPSATPTPKPPPPTDTPEPVPSIGYFRADQTTIEPGQCTRIEWGQVKNANIATLTDVGRVNFSGRLDVCLDTSKTYTLRVEGSGGSAEKTAVVAVQPPVSPVIEFFRVAPSIVAPGDCALLEWGIVGNANSASIEPDIGGVGTPGSQEVCPGDTTTYILTAQNVSATMTSEATLIVSNQAAQKPVIPFFTANPSSIRAGECTLLSWGKVDYATEVTIDNNLGGVATPGSKEVCPGTTMTFIMTAVGPGGETEYSLPLTVSPGQLANLPNLVVEAILFEPNPCYRSQGCKVRVKVRNDGSVAAGHFIVRWAPVGDETVPVEWDVDGLGVDEEKALSYNWIPNQARENWRTTATVDVYDDVREIEEGAANFLEQFITVLDP